MTQPSEIRNEEDPNTPPTSSDDRRQVLKAALLRPINLLMPILGVFAAVFFAWWFLPLSVVTYALLVLLASRDPIFTQRVLGDLSSPAISQPTQDMSPERRVRWLPRGETRRRLEEALDVYRKTVTAIEESDDVTHSVLGDAIPKLHAAANQLVDVGSNREKAATMIAELESLTNTSEDHEETIRKLREEIRDADAEISDTYGQLISLRTGVAQISIAKGPEGRATATQVNASLDELNLRLQALEETMASSNEHLNPPVNSPEQPPQTEQT